ncbi:MAG: nucleotide-binding protein, partial [Magnetococcales bacterium]|nr:nucleotide-binding protein [Magnetococcales bacterium]MBF0117187.1 nucleotide-binding protein [Magnetococcales bacterium]
GDLQEETDSSLFSNAVCPIFAEPAHFVIDVMDRKAFFIDDHTIRSFLDDPYKMRPLLSTDANRQGQIRHRPQIFIIHGHEPDAVTRIQNILRQLKVEPLVLSQIASQGLTIIEALERYGNPDFACALFTADDSCTDSKGKSRVRARQNVVLETGMLISKIGRTKVMLLMDPEVEKPSDLNGILYVPLSKPDEVISKRFIQSFITHGIAYYPLTPIA